MAAQKIVCITHPETALRVLVFAGLGSTRTRKRAVSGLVIQITILLHVLVFVILGLSFYISLVAG